MPPDVFPDQATDARICEQLALLDLNRINDPQSLSYSMTISDTSLNRISSFEKHIQTILEQCSELPYFRLTLTLSESIRRSLRLNSSFYSVPQELLEKLVSVILTLMQSTTSMTMSSDALWLVENHINEEIKTLKELKIRNSDLMEVYYLDSEKVGQVSLAIS